MTIQLNEHVDVVVSCITPLESFRYMARSICGAKNFRLVHIKAAPSVCRKRDPKGLWAKAERGEILNFTGLTAPFEQPRFADLVICTDCEAIPQSVATMIKFVRGEEKQWALYIGRWQPFHKGHEFIIRKAIRQVRHNN